MNPALQRYLDAASGLTSLTAAKAEQIAKNLVKSGEAASEQVNDLVDELMTRQRKNREAISALIRSETSRAVQAAGLVSSRDLERLEKQVADLRREVARLEKAVGTGSGTAKKAAKKGTAKKAAKKGTAKKAAKKGTAKKATKKATKKSTAKQATKRTSGGS